MSMTKEELSEILGRWGWLPGEMPERTQAREDVETLLVACRRAERERDSVLADRDRLTADRDRLTNNIRARVEALSPANTFALSERDLLLRAVRTAGHGGPPRPRWAAVREVFSLGSTSATAMCLALGFDPDEQVGIDDREEQAMATNPASPPVDDIEAIRERYRTDSNTPADVAYLLVEVEGLQRAEQEGLSEQGGVDPAWHALEVARLTLAPETVALLVTARAKAHAGDDPELSRAWEAFEDAEGAWLDAGCPNLPKEPTPAEGDKSPALDLVDSIAAVIEPFTPEEQARIDEAQAGLQELIGRQRAAAAALLQAAAEMPSQGPDHLVACAAAYREALTHAGDTGTVEASDAPA